jgi:hypothetical protein
VVDALFVGGHAGETGVGPGLGVAVADHVVKLEGLVVEGARCGVVRLAKRDVAEATQCVASGRRGSIPSPTCACGSPGAPSVHWRR